MSQSKINGSGETPTAQDPKAGSLEADIIQLSTILSQDTLTDADDTNVAELLQRLESADGMAKGVESKLDSILGSLDKLLADLETKNDTPISSSTNHVISSDSDQEKKPNA